jgi:hypothetical protein
MEVNMKKIIIAIIIAVILVGVFYIVANADEWPPPPTDDSCCVNGWYELWHIPNSKYCDGGDFYQWHCQELGGVVANHDILYTSVCISSIQLPLEINTIYFPTIIKEQ